MPFITTFYSDRAGSRVYKRYAERLEKDLQAIGAEFRVDQLPYRGTWLETCRAKPAYLESVLERVCRPVVWIDADSRVNKPLAELDATTYDVAAPSSSLPPLGSIRFHVEVALIYLNYTPGAREFLARWRTKCEGLDWPVGDHCHFLSTWEEMEAERQVKLVKLPRTACGRGGGDGNLADLITSEFPGKQAELERALRFHHREAKSQ